MKIIAYYLPQFHEVKENNEWWGEGFTEWTNIRNAKKHFDNHSLNLPLDDNYYDLSDIQTLKWQANLSRKYGIEGMCFYHYWFNGRKILEKPSELLLKNPDVDMNFCFCWANHSWTKSWRGSKELLIEQTYGDQDEWDRHIEYLLPFFNDKRYLKKDNKPIFQVYSAKSIPFFDERFEYYNKIVKQHGFDGIYLIETVQNLKKYSTFSVSNAVSLREPSISISSQNKLKRLVHILKANGKNKYLKPSVYSARKLNTNSQKLIDNFDTDKDIIQCAYYAWDSTSRHSNRGYVITNNLTDFEKYLLQINKRIESNSNFSEFCFYNAWNEWAEGMMLEPTKNDKYKVLESLLKFSK